MKHHAGYSDARTRRHRYLKHFNQHQTGYLAVKRTPRIITYLKQVSMPAGFRRIVRSRTSSVNDLLSRNEPGTARLILRALVSIVCLFAAAPAFAQADLAGATDKLTLQVDEPFIEALGERLYLSSCEPMLSQRKFKFYLAVKFPDT